MLICEWIGLIRGLHAVHLPHPPCHRFPAITSLSPLHSQDLLSPCAEAGAATASTCSPLFAFTLPFSLKLSFREPLVQGILRSGDPLFRESFVQGRAVGSPGGFFLLRALGRHIAKPDDRPRSPIAPVSDLGLQYAYFHYAPVTSSFAPGACLLLYAHGLPFADRPHVHLPDHLVNLVLFAV